MESGKYTRFLILPAFMFLFLMNSTPSQGIDSPVTKTVTPTLPSGTTATQLKSFPSTIAGPTSSSACMLTSVSPAAAEVGQEVVVTGQGLSATCSVYFQNPAGGVYATGNQLIDPSHLKVIVPVMASGKGTIAVREKNSAATMAMDSTGHVLPFEVKPTVPVLQSITASPVTPGQQVQVVGSPLKQGEVYTAYFVSSEGKSASAPVTWLNATTFRAVVPDLERYAYMNEGTQYANTFYVKRGSTPSNRLTLKVLPAPKCVIMSVNPTVQWAKGYVDLTGSYLTRDCDITFYSSTGQAFTATNKGARDYGINVQVPDMPGGKGYVSAKPAGSSQAGAKIPFEAKALPALLANRVDVQTTEQGFGQRVMSVPSKPYKALSSPVTPDYPFECDAQCEVYQNGGVYTYVYTFDIKEYVVTQKNLGYLALKWPDLNDSSLKYGFDLKHMGISSDAFLLKGETQHELQMTFWTRGKKHSSYIQSKRAPVKGWVRMADVHGQVIDVYDFYVPAP
jgi:hypothetical protein